ncbi:MAG TPA: family 1 glycosylhydrolase, partial [Candidatus Ozemobacteraceae bacterium]|nr:family 1 glycosylhydrolase [Candidatus Ozemobacteraceae bacterium]
MQYRFPTSFVWGAATAALQIEGATAEDGRGPSLWDTFCHQHPERIFEHANPDIACDHYHRYAEDVELIKAMGHTGYRLSISWSRLFPTGDPTQLNQAGVVFYRRLLDALSAKQIVANVTLYHW